MELNDLKNKEIHIIGISGVEGSSIALFLIKLGCQNLIGHDFSKKDEFKKNYLNYHQSQSKKINLHQLQIIKKGVKKLNFFRDYLKGIKEAEFIFSPSSWFRYKRNSSLKKLKNGQIFWNWYNLLLEFYPGTLVGVTGTAGKGTTTNLIFSIIKTVRKKIWLVGDSWQMIDLNQLLKADKKSFVIAELSNRTLKFTKYSKKSPQISVITNITKNHLDDHQGSFKKYITIKKEIARYQTKDDFLILNRDNQITKNLENFGKGKKIFYSRKSPEKKLIKNKKIIGNHLKANAIAAIKTARILKIRDYNIIKGLNNFKPREGRMQLIKIIKDISFINDAASTRPEATIEAIKTFSRDKVNLILEGSRYKPDKKQFLKLIETINNYRVKKVAVSGQIAKFLFPLLQKTKAEIFKTKNLTESMKKTYQNTKSGEVILVSPSCESFGEFNDYRERINKFNQIVAKLSYAKKVKN